MIMKQFIMKLKKRMVFGETKKEENTIILDKMGGNMSELKSKEYKRFEDIKQVRLDGREFWSAREFTPVLEYTK